MYYESFHFVLSIINSDGILCYQSSNKWERIVLKSPWISPTVSSNTDNAQMDTRAILWLQW